MLKENKRNLLHIELLRIIAAYFVIFNHTKDNGSTLHLPDPSVCFIYGGDSVPGISFRAGQRENVWRTQSRVAIHQYRILAAAGILSGKCI